MSTTVLQQIAAAQNWQLRVNENFNSASPAGLFGVNPASSVGLTLGYLGGNFNGNSVANGTVAITASTTSYVVANRSTGVVSSATTTTNWLDVGGYLQLYQVVAGASTITSIDDKRQAYGGSGSGSGGDMLSVLTAAEVSVTTTATLSVGRMHVCSGTTADYTITLPAASGNAGKFVGVRMAQGLARWVTLKGNSTELIDGSNTRLMWSGESAVLMCDGTGWAKITGRTKPLHCSMRRTAALSIPAAAWTIIPTPVVISDNSASILAVPLADTTNGRIRILRNAPYVLSGFTSIEAVVVGKGIAGGVIANAAGVATPADDPNGWMSTVADSGGFAQCAGTGIFRPAVGNVATLIIFNQDTVARNTRSNASCYPTVSLVEQPEW